MGDSRIDGSFSAVGVSSSFHVPPGGQVVVLVFGTYSASLELQKSDNGAAWVKVRDITGPIKLYSDESSSDMYRLVCTAYTSGTATYECIGAQATHYYPQAQWDDLRFPASGINPPGAVSDPDRDPDDGMLAFDAAATEVVAIQVIFPHNYKQGTTVRPHVHWMKTTSAAGDVKWRLEYKVFDPNEVLPGAWTTLDVTSAAAGTPDTDTANKHLISEFGPIGLDSSGVAPALIMKLSRIGGDAADTYGADAKLIEFDIHYLIDTWGSGAEFIK